MWMERHSRIFEKEREKKKKLKRKVLFVVVGFESGQNGIL
jgi:hypothetical protein